jgi:large repetitive protein
MTDNDNDMLTDWGPSGDPTCTSASNASEACPVTDGVTIITTASTMGTLTGATNDGKPSCASTSSTVMVPDRMYRLDLPAMTTLQIDNVNTFSGAMALYNSTCVNPSLACASISSPERITVANIPAGPYYYVVDGYSTVPTTPTYTINVSGTIQAGERCDGPLATAGAITCSLGYACTGTGMKTCTPASCFDGVDGTDPEDTIADFPFDPGCDSPGDTSETDPGTKPNCADNMDNDGDGQTDYPNDFGCSSASSNVEAFCTAETDRGAAAMFRITQKTSTGTTAGRANDHAGTCVGASSTNAPDVALGLQLPVPVATLVIDTEMSLFDTILIVKKADCSMQLACDDEGGVGTNTSKVTLTGVDPGAYAVIVDGWSTQNGMFSVQVQGTVSPGTSCSSALFSGANPVLLCPSGTTCTGTPAKCQ